MSQPIPVPSHEEFRFFKDVDIRFRDLDGMGHVNNAVFITYFEIARSYFTSMIKKITLIIENIFFTNCRLLKIRISLIFGFSLSTKDVSGIVRTLSTEFG